MADSFPGGRGRLITFEGIDGAGKSSQLQAAVEFLRARGLDPAVTREPGGTALGEELRVLLLGHATQTQVTQVTQATHTASQMPSTARTTPITALAELLLMFAARSQSLAEVVLPALEAGRVVLSDRFSDASFAYQSGGRGLPAPWVTTLEHWTHPDLQPHGTLLFDLDPQLAARRVQHAARSATDRFERETLEFYVRVRAAYLMRARQSPQRFAVLDAEQPPGAVAEQVRAALLRWIA